MEVAKKLALVTKVGGGNGVNLDPYRSKGKRARRAVEGVAYLSAEHPDVEDFIRGLMRPPINPDGAKEEISLKNFARVVYGALSPELKALAERYGVRTVKEPPEGRILVPDDMGGIIDAAREAADLARKGQKPHVDFSLLRPEGAPIRGSGGTSSGPVSFLFEIFDNFLEWVAWGPRRRAPWPPCATSTPPCSGWSGREGASIPTPWSTPTGAPCASGSWWTPSGGAGNPTL